MTAPDDPGAQPGSGSTPDPGPPTAYAAAAGDELSFGPQPAPRSNRARLLIASAAAVVVAGGGVATYVAVSSASSDRSSPRAAVQRLVTDLGRADLIAVMNDLPPNERAAIAGPLAQTMRELQRTKVVRPNADLHEVGGVSFSAVKLTFAAKTVPIGAHVQVVQVTGGTLRLRADVARLPLTSAFLDAASAGSAPQGNATRTVDIGRLTRSTGRPVRIAVQQVGDGWYPSLSYTIADYAATDSGLPAPTAAARVPAVGERSADAAVSTLLTSLLRGNVRRAIELVSPQEMPVLHDYGSLIASRAQYPAAPLRLRDIRFTDTPESGGTGVGIKSLSVSVQGVDARVDLSGSCPKVTTFGRTERLCPDRLLAQFGGFGIRFTSAQRQALAHLFAGLFDQRIHTSRIDGAWYVDPVRTYADQLPRLLSHLHGDDLLVLIALADEH